MGHESQVSHPKQSLLSTGCLHWWLAPDVAEQKLLQEVVGPIPLAGPSFAVSKAHTRL